MAVSWMWPVLVGTTPIIVSLLRDLILLCRHVIRRASIERLVRNRTGVIWIVDRTAEGDVLEVGGIPPFDKCPSGPDLKSGEA